MAARQRLQKLLSAAGIASRRAGEELIRQGRVRVNREVVTELGIKADLERDRVEVDGVRVRAARRKLHLLLYKPPGTLSAMSDPAGRPTLADLLGPLDVRLYHAGRLDLKSEGLLLMTNDGELAQRVTHPRYGCKKTYHVKVRGEPSEKTLQRLRQGVLLDGRRTAPATVRIISVTGRAGHAWLAIVLREGRSRQVRRMLELVGHPVSKLRRVRIGPLSSRGLERGAYRQLTERELEALWRDTRLEQEVGSG
jgi:23S rRNA pseudouridine2605 synthase